ncbi:MAG: hypothetical protein RIG61_08095 [Deltaproteobacteria bacterium]
MKNIVIALLLGFLLSGCGAASGIMQKDDQESLSKSTDLYYKLIMWKYYDKAARFVDPAKLKDYEGFVLRNEKDLNITSYQIKEIVYLVDGEPEGTGTGKESKECLVRVSYTYYKYPSVSEKSVMVQDNWVRNGKIWYVSSDYEKGTFE